MCSAGSRHGGKVKAPRSMIESHSSWSLLFKPMRAGRLADRSKAASSSQNSIESQIESEFRLCNRSTAKR